MDDNENQSDWSPPPELLIEESEVFAVPSGLPSFAEFMRRELEKEEAGDFKSQEFAEPLFKEDDDDEKEQDDDKADKKSDDKEEDEEPGILRPNVE